MIDKSKTYTVATDYECNSQEWWDHVNAATPAGFDPGLDEQTVTGATLLALMALPGWDTGDDHARTPLIVDL